MIKSIELNRRMDCPDGYWYLIINGKEKYSLINTNITMGTFPLKKIREHFNFWEAIRIDKKGNLIVEEFFRGKNIWDLVEEIETLAPTQSIKQGK